MCGFRRKGRHPEGFAALPCGGQAGGHSLDVRFSEKKTTSRGFRLRPSGEIPWMHGRRTPGVGFSALFHVSRGFRFAGIVHSGGLPFRHAETVHPGGFVLRKACAWRVSFCGNRVTGGSVFHMQGRIPWMHGNVREIAHLRAMSHCATQRAFRVADCGRMELGLRRPDAPRSNRA